MNFCSRAARPFTNMLVISRCLSTVPTRGKYSRDIANYEKEIESLKEQRAKCLELRDNVENGKTKKKLTERDLSFLRDPLDAKYVRLTFNLLSQNKRLDFLNKSHDEIYPGQDCNVDPIIETVRKQYEKETISFTFGCIVPYLQQLSRGDVSQLKRFFYSKQVEDINSAIDNRKKLIEYKKIDLAICKKLAEKKVSDFPKGNFGFISDELGRKNLKTAYKIFQKMNEWDYLIPDNPKYKEFEKELVKRDISKAYVEWIAKQFKDMYNEGWEKFVASYIDAARKDLGIEITKNTDRCI